MKKIQSILLATSLLATTAYAQAPFVLDQSFGTNGVSITSNPLFGTNPFASNHVWNMAVDNDNKIVLGSHLAFNYCIQCIGSTFSLTRLTPDGQLDPTFNGNGQVVFHTSQYKDLSNLLVLPDNKILYGGYMHVNGTNYILVYKINTNGTFDMQFGNGGKAQIPGLYTFNHLRGMNVQSNGKILLLTHTFANNSQKGAIIRLNANGSLDNTFGTNGIMYPTIGFSDDNISYGMMKVLPDNSYLVAGSHIFGNNPGDNEIFVAKFNADGTLQTSFGNNGKQILPKLPTERMNTYSFINKFINVDSNGNIYINCSITNSPPVGWLSTNINVYKLTPNGNLVTNYGTGGRKILSNMYGESYYRFESTIQNGDKLVLASMADSGANANYIVQRLNADGTDDLTFAGNSSQIVATRNARDHFGFVSLQSNNKIIVGGYGHRDNKAGDTLYPVLMRFSNVPTVNPPVDTGTTDTSSSIVNINNQDRIKIFPNPTDNWMHIQGIKGNAEINIYDILGRKVMQLQLSNKSSNTINCSELAPSVYYMYLKEEKSPTIYGHRFIKN